MTRSLQPPSSRRRVDLRHLGAGGDGGHRTRRCWPRTAPRRRSRCSATPVGAGTSSARRTTPPEPVSASPRPTGRSATRRPPPRRSRGRRRRTSGSTYLPARELPDGLTRRESEVLTLVADGRSNRQIGEALYISDRTVARHLTNIFTKIGVTSRTQAARYAIDRGLTDTGEPEAATHNRVDRLPEIGQSRRCRRAVAWLAVPVDAPNNRRSDRSRGTSMTDERIHRAVSADGTEIAGRVRGRGRRWSWSTAGSGTATSPGGSAPLPHGPVHLLPAEHPRPRAVERQPGPLARAPGG